jgi:DNA-binding NtrC family response regulator
VNIHVPPLAERREDIPALVEHFVEDFKVRYKRNIQGFDSQSLRNLCEASWPGNVRELRNTIERCVILAEQPVLQWLTQEKSDSETLDDENPVMFSEDEFFSLTELEQQYINHVLKCFNGKKTKAAEILGIDKTTLWRKLRRYESDSETV